MIAEAHGRLVGLATLHIFELIYRPRPQCRLTELVLDAGHHLDGYRNDLIGVASRLAAEPHAG